MGGVSGAETALSEQENAPAAEITGGHGCAAVSESDMDDTAEALTEESDVIAPVTTVGNAGQGDVSFGCCSKNEDHDVPKENPATTRYELRGFRPARRAIAHAMPPSTYRRLPLRSRKRSNPTRLIVVGDAASGVADAHDRATSEEASGPPTSAMVSAAHGDNDEAIDSTCSRKQKRRWDHFISDIEEAVSADRTKAHRSDTALDRFLASSVGASSPEQRPGWPVRRNVTADDGVRHHQGQPGNEALSTASGGGPEEPDGSGRRILAIVAILGASLALSVVSCVLIYIAGQRTASGACDTHQKK